MALDIGAQDWARYHSGEGQRPAGYNGEGGGSSSGGSDPIGLAKQFLGFQQQANQPAIQSYQAQLPEIAQRYQTQNQQLESSKQPLQDRYTNIINQLKGTQAQDIKTQNNNLSTEYGKRGVPLSSGVFQQDLANKTSGINQYYGGQIANAGISENQGLQDIQNQQTNLIGQQTDAQRAIQNAIAQLQAGNPESAISGGISAYGQQQAQQQFAQQQQFAAQQAAIQNALAQSQYQNISLPTAQANIRNINSEIGNRGLQYAAPGQALSFLQNQLGGGNANSEYSGGEQFNPSDNSSQYVQFGSNLNKYVG